MANDSDSEILKRVENIESLLKEYLSFRSMFGDYDRIMKNYLKLVNMFLTYGKITPSILTGEKLDPISESIVEALFNLEVANISQIAEELRKARGSASRTTVKKRIADLEKRGIVSSTGEKEKRYRISESVVSEWLKLVGMDIKGDNGLVNRWKNGRS